MKNVRVVTNTCQRSPRAGSCRALSQATRAAFAGSRVSEEPHPRETPQPSASAPLPLKCYLRSFASFTLRSLVLFILGLLEMFSS